MTTSTGSGLWNEGFGAVGATLKALEDAGATMEYLKLIRSDGTVAKGVVEFLCKVSKSLYMDEEVASSYTYADGYVLKPLADQIAMLSKLFGLDGAKALAYAENLPKLPEGAEGWFAVPKWQTIGETYGKAVEKVLGLLGESRKFKNWREGQLDEKYLRQTERTEQMLAKLCEQQEGDIVIIPSQFGLRHRGRSVRRARVVFVGNEFGFGSFINGCILLTHPEREQTWEQLHIDCAGDEYAPDGDGKFVGAPIFGWNDGKLHFNTNWTNNANKQYGSASGFLPKFLLIKKTSFTDVFCVLFGSAGFYPPSEHSSHLVGVLLKQ